MFSSVDIVNIRDNIKCLKSQCDDMISQYHEILVIIDTLEYFLSHFEDSNIEEDLPL